MTQKLPSLDGWRAVSILLLLLGHAAITPGFPAFLNGAHINSFGIMGVRFFFIISGFLITWLLLREREKTGGIHLKNFYVRRVLRIFPVCYVYLGVLGLLTAYHQGMMAWLANLTFTTNYVPVGVSTSHLWSLAVEEQFYLLWPFLLVLVPPVERKILVILMIPVVTAPVIRSLALPPVGTFNLFGYWSFFSEFDLLAFGCIAAVLLTHHRVQLGKVFLRYPGLTSLLSAGLVLASVCLRPHLHGFYETVQGIGFTGLLLGSVMRPEMAWFHPLNWGWVRQIGILSYSIYIWQMMFCTGSEAVFGVKSAWWLDFPVWILLSVLMALASYWLLEKPMFSLRERFRT